jgi:acetylornithine deacetylase/succinyl-diaminopimelate desuccinylase-like protein
MSSSLDVSRGVEADTDALRAEAAALLRRLVTCDTSNPPGRESQAVAVIEDHLRDTGLECRRIAEDPDRANLLVRLPGVGTGPSLAFLGHLDVVPARREDWSVDPFAGVDRDGAIWGRGTVDMKGQVAATTVALATLARQGFRPNGDILLMFMANEEVAGEELGAQYFAGRLPDLCPDYVIGEGAGERFATDRGPIYLLDHGVKASAGATLTAYGHPGDASLPGPAQSALSELVALLGRLERHRSPVQIPDEMLPVLDVLGGAGSREEQLTRARAQHPGLDRILGALTGTVMHVTTAEVPPPENVIADRACASITCSVLPGTSTEELEQELRTALGEGRYDLEVVAPVGGSTSPAESPLRSAIESFLAAADPEARLLPALGYGYSDCDVIRKAYGSVAYGFIPFRHGDPMVNLTTKHGADERVLLDDLLFQTQAALAVARSVGGLSR